jgi:hypothetical protein
MSREAIKEKCERGFRAIFHVSAITEEGIDDVFHHLGEFDFMVANEMIARPHIAVEAAPERKCCEAERRRLFTEQNPRHHKTRMRLSSGAGGNRGMASWRMVDFLNTIPSVTPSNLKVLGG